jgi:serine phosphatase RsbU (regulator of sigma subunit)
MLTMLGILIHRFTRTSLEEESHKRELEAARIVQQVLIPEAIPKIPGLVLDAVYKPAGQVGGDFFQILPAENGSVLVVIGDVSGKGMPAAMTVSLLVGTVRTLAHFTQQPGAILSAMNHRMMGRTNGGFTTCLVLRLDQDGTLTVANAGHLPPYVNGNELHVENGLPLGLDTAATYPESHFHLAGKDQLTLITDGVAEARSRTGELFGFERTQSIATQAAESIVDTARHFGQEDDITVLTLARI